VRSIVRVVIINVITDVLDSARNLTVKVINQLLNDVQLLLSGSLLFVVELFSSCAVILCSLEESTINVNKNVVLGDEGFEFVESDFDFGKALVIDAYVALESVNLVGKIFNETLNVSGNLLVVGVNLKTRPAKVIEKRADEVNDGRNLTVVVLRPRGQFCENVDNGFHEGEIGVFSVLLELILNGAEGLVHLNERLAVYSVAERKEQSDSFFTSRYSFTVVSATFRVLGVLSFQVSLALL
jgi:hypothetical protein